MAGERQHIAIDCGNSSMRVVSGTFDGRKIKTNLVLQVSNDPVCVNGLYYWDILRLFYEMQEGVRKARREFGEIASIGVSTWGIDFALLGPSGQMLGNPLCYRNPLGAAMLSRLSEEEKSSLFLETGICEHPMNTLYQLLGLRQFLPELYAKADRLLLVPDLFVWMLTGVMRSEPTIASTTQMCDMRDGAYSKAVLDRFGISSSLFPPMIAHGEVYGLLRPELAENMGIDPCPVVCVPSHDTASAVVSVPADEDSFAFISSGTWSLIGTEIERPLITPAVRAAGFSNEGGVEGSVTLLKNSAGMFILQNIKAELEAEGTRLDWGDLVAMAERHPGEALRFDPNHPDFYKPESMIDAIRRHLGEAALSREQIVASAYLSLAQSYRLAVNDLEVLTGRNFNKVHIIGGGCRNAFLNQMTANLLGKTITAGPDEATSLGNIGVQLMRENPGMGLRDLRRILKRSVVVNEFKPKAR